VVDVVGLLEVVDVVDVVGVVDVVEVVGVVDVVEVVGVVDVVEVVGVVDVVVVVVGTGVPTARQETLHVACRSNPSTVRADQATVWTPVDAAVLLSVPGTGPDRATPPTVSDIVKPGAPAVDSTTTVSPAASTRFWTKPR
jgi:hypothetical protein